MVELNGQGQSDLIVVNGPANVNGGLVEASSIDGTFAINTPYLILTSQNLSGDFAAATYSHFGHRQANINYRCAEHLFDTGHPI